MTSYAPLRKQETLLISGVNNKLKHVQYLGRQVMTYINLAWRDGPIAEVVREARLSLSYLPPPAAQP